MVLRFNIGKCEFVIEYSFILLLSFITLLGYDKTFLVLIFSALHESAHIIALLIFGQNPRVITFSFYGIGLKFDNRLSSVKEFAFLCAGPFLNLIFSVAFIKSKEISLINFALFLINSYPLVPLDGGRALKTIINSFFSSDLSRKIYITINLFFYLFLVFLSVVLMIKFKSVSLMLITAYIGLFNLSSIKREYFL